MNVTLLTWDQSIAVNRPVITQAIAKLMTRLRMTPTIPRLRPRCPRPVIQMLNASNATLQIPIIKTASAPDSQSNQRRVRMTPSPHFLPISQAGRHLVRRPLMDAARV